VGGLQLLIAGGYASASAVNTAVPEDASAAVNVRPDTSIVHAGASDVHAGASGVHTGSSGVHTEAFGVYAEDFSVGSPAPVHAGVAAAVEAALPSGVGTIVLSNSSLAAAVAAKVATMRNDAAAGLTRDAERRASGTRINPVDARADRRDARASGGGAPRYRRGGRASETAVPFETDAADGVGGASSDAAAADTEAAYDAGARGGRVPETAAPSEDAAADTDTGVGGASPDAVAAATVEAYDAGAWAAGSRLLHGAGDASSDAAAAVPVSAYEASAWVAGSRPLHAGFPTGVRASACSGMAGSLEAALRPQVRILYTSRDENCVWVVGLRVNPLNP